MTNAPGWLSSRGHGEPNRIIIEHVYSTVPKNGVVLELGSMFGATTEIISKHMKPSAHIYVIDSWGPVPISELLKLKRHSSKGHKKIMDDIVKTGVEKNNRHFLPGDRFYDWWKYFTKDLKNVTHFREDVLKVAKNKIPEVDLIVQDAQHHYEGVLAELEYWWPKLKPGGTLIMDDYNYRDFPGAVKAAEEFFSRNKYITKVPTSCCLLIVKKGK
jgi:23S rRNA U2552 (ribose-2'-O)-methylase RlmE/FtsJ